MRGFGGAAWGVADGRWGTVYVFPPVSSSGGGAVTLL